MSISYINRKTLTTSIAIIMVCGHALAGTVSESSEPLALKKIMQDMGKNMQLIVDGISREDWKLVENTTPLIANHPQPPVGEKVKILSFINKGASKFKSYDGKTHESALALGEAATREDAQAVIAGFAALQKTCLACHQSFRKSIQNEFYGMR